VPPPLAETLVLLVSSFWLGAVHAATPGHGKTIAAAYIVGARGRPVDALVLGIFVTLSHTSGIVLVAVLASLGSAWLIPHRVEAYLALATGVLVIAIGLWMLIAQRASLRSAATPSGDDETSFPDDPAGGDPEHAHHHSHAHGDEHAHHPHHHDGEDGHDHSHPHGAGEHAHDHGEPGYHSHGWGRRHTHRLDAIAGSRPSLPVLLGLGIAGGLLPDPGALAILLAAIASGRVILGLFTVVVFSIGFASVLVAVGIVAARVGQIVLTWLEGRWVAWVQSAAALVIVGVGVVLTTVAWRTLSQLR
jgi:nickel/cobalt transporter (NicO) family protein